MRVETVKLKCKGKIIKAKKVSLSLAKNLYQDLIANPEEEINFGSVNFKVLKKALDYCNYHAERQRCHI